MNTQNPKYEEEGKLIVKKDKICPEFPNKISFHGLLRTVQAFSYIYSHCMKCFAKRINTYN